MKIKSSVKAYRQPIINAVILAVILVLFLYVGVQLSRNFSDMVSTQRTQTVTDNRYLNLTGYVFRNEQAVTRSQNGVADYAVLDGEKIGVNALYAVYYTAEGKSSDEIAKVRSEVGSLSDRIERLRSEISGGGTVSDLAHISVGLDSAYYSYVDMVLEGEFDAADRIGEHLLASLVNYSVVTGRDGVAESMVSTLEEQKAAALSSLGGSKSHLSSDRGCYFFYDCDGYESIYSVSALEGMTREHLDEIISSEPEIYEGYVIGKRVFDPKWYLAVPADEATALKFTSGEVYQISYPSDGGAMLDMKLERVEIDEEGGAYLLFSNLDLSVSSSFPRSQDIKILMGSDSGYRIPEEAMTALDGDDGVYILVGNVVKFRRVTVISRGNGYYIVNTYEKDLDDDSTGDTPYLKANDMIITSGNDLYDGKLID